MEFEHSDDSKHLNHVHASNHMMHNHNSNLSTMTLYNFPISNNTGQPPMQTVTTDTMSFNFTPQHHQVSQIGSPHSNSCFGNQSQQPSMFQGFNNIQVVPQGSMFNGFGNWTPQIPNSMESFANRSNVFDKHMHIFETPKRVTRASRAKIIPENIVLNNREVESDDEDFNQIAEEEDNRSSDGLNDNPEEEENSEGDSFDGLVEDEEDSGPIDLNDYMQQRAFL